MKIKLKKGARIQLNHIRKNNSMDSKVLKTTKEIYFDTDEFPDKEFLFYNNFNGKRTYRYREPFPVYNGIQVHSIEWLKNDDNESTVI